MASLCFHPETEKFRSLGMVAPTDRERSCPVMVSGALATEKVLLTGSAANAEDVSAAVAVTVPCHLRMIPQVPLISRILESLDV